MKNELLKNVFQNMDYNTYKKLDKISFISSMYGAINPTFITLINFPSLEIVLTTYVLLNQVYFGITNLSYCEQYTKEILKITNLYNELIDNYVKFNKDFNLEHPIEIYQLYNYMLYNGYLSKNGKFEFGESPIKDIWSLLGVNVVTGKAVCRHIASMLNDTYNKMDINAYTYNCHLDSNGILFDTLKENISTLETILESLSNNNERKELEKLISAQKKLLKNYKPPLIKKSNHLINISSKDGICYITDSTNQMILKKEEDKEYKNILKLDLISPLGSKIKLIKSHGNYDKKREILLLPNSSEEDDDKIITNINTLCNNNLDLLNKFRCENSELYSDINDKLMKIKKKK